MKSLYASGQTAKELSEKFGISETKIKNWQHKQDWASARKEYDLKRSQTLYAKLLEQETDIVEKNLKLVNAILDITAAEIEKAKVKADDEEKVKDLLKLATIMEKSSRIFKNVIPDVSENVSEQILTELKALNPSPPISFQEGENNPCYQQNQG